MPTLTEKHLNYIVNAITSAQSRQERLWAELDANRDGKGIIPLTDPVLDEYCEAARMTASLMIDIEMVREEYLAQQSGKGRRGSAGRKKAASRKKATRKKTTRKKATRKKAAATAAAPRAARKKTRRKKAARSRKA